MKDLTLCDGFGYMAPILFFQGCSIRCPGCHNSQLWDKNGGEVIDIALIKNEILYHIEDYEGIVFQGGEPTDQPEALLDIMQFTHSIGLKNILYTGKDVYELDDRILDLVDIIKCGKYGTQQFVLNKIDNNISTLGGGNINE